MSAIGLFGQAIVEPMPSDQLHLFHQPVPAPPIMLPGTTAQDRKIARKFSAAATPMLPAKPPRRNRLGVLAC